MPRLIQRGLVKPMRLLDFVLAEAAYGLRAMRRDWSGPLVRVRRSSDNAERDIGPDYLGRLDVAGLLAFVGAGDGFVPVWYDQSGNRRNATRTLTTEQPRIVNAGVLETLNGRPALRVNNTPMQIGAAGILVPSMNAVLNTDPAVPAVGALISANSDNSIRRTITPGLGWRANDTSDHVFPANSVFINGANASATLDGAAGATNSTGVNTVFTAINGQTANAMTWLFRNVPNPARFYVGHVAEVVLFGGNLTTAERQAIERNQGAHFGISIS